jgi:hypothetical protein
MFRSAQHDSGSMAGEKSNRRDLIFSLCFLGASVIKIVAATRAANSFAYHSFDVRYVRSFEPGPQPAMHTRFLFHDITG